MRPFPHNLIAERALLGGLIRDPERLLEVQEVVSADDFYRPDHQKLFALLKEMQGRGEAIDMVTVPDRIGREGRADEFGGVAYLMELPDHAPSTANLVHYADVIREKSLLRSLIRASEGLSESAYAEPEDVEALLERASKEIFGLGQGRGKRSWHPISLVIDDELRRIESLGQRDDGITGVTTGFLDLDHKLAGLQRTDLIILAARPAMGKTALALNIAQNAAMLGGVGVGLFSMEMSRGQLVTRMLCTQAMVDAGRLRLGRLDEDDWSRLIEADELLRPTSIHIDDTPGLSISELSARARRLKSTHPEVGLLVIDYLQLMGGDDRRAPREQQISAISRGLKGLAKDLDLPIVALSQLNRGVESRQDKRPMVSDLRESGAIEQDADIIMFIYRDDYYNPDSTDKGLAELIIAKQRNGPTGTVKLVFQGQYTRFDNLADEGFNL